MAKHHSLSEGGLLQVLFYALDISDEAAALLVPLVDMMAAEESAAVEVPAALESANDDTIPDETTEEPTARPADGFTCSARGQRARGAARGESGSEKRSHSAKKKGGEAHIES